MMPKVSRFRYSYRLSRRSAAGSKADSLCATKPDSSICCQHGGYQGSGVGSSVFAGGLYRPSRPSGFIETPWGTMRMLRLAEEHGLPRPVSIQNPYNLLNRAFEIGLAEIAIREHCGLLAYSPLAFGVLSGKYLDGARPAGARLTGSTAIPAHVWLRPPWPAHRGWTRPGWPWFGSSVSPS